MLSNPNSTRQPHRHYTQKERGSSLKAYLICNALVPNTLARSYLVIYGVVVLFSFGIRLLLIPFTLFISRAACACAASLTSPLATMGPAWV